MMKKSEFLRYGQYKTSPDKENLKLLSDQIG